ncbi:Solute carrier family 35 member F1 [Linum perenne]
MELQLSNLWWRAWVIFLGQAVSFSLALASFTSSLIASLGVDAPISQSCFSYLILALVYGSILLRRGRKLQVPWYWYLLLGFIDVHGNYLVNKAYQYSSITSVTLLDCWTIPWVIILTWLLLGTRYSILQLLGSAICLLGLALVLFSDAWMSDGVGGGSNPLLGDTLVILGTVFFALSNVGEEFCVKKRDRIEVVAMLGVFGLLISLVELSVFEISTLKSVNWSVDIILAVAGFTVAIFSFYSITPYVLKWSGATLFNLSILTSDMWAVLIRIFFYGQKVDWLYFLAFVLVATGLITYSITEKEDVHSSKAELRNPSGEPECEQQQQPLLSDETTNLSKMNV